MIRLAAYLVIGAAIYLAGGWAIGRALDYQYRLECLARGTADSPESCYSVHCQTTGAVQCGAPNGR